MKKYILFGAGNFGKMALKHYGEENVEYFVDNNKVKVGKNILGKKIISFDEYKKIADRYQVVISSNYLTQIAEQLQENGILNYIYYSPSYEKFIKDIEVRLNKLNVTSIAVYGIDGYTEQLISRIMNSSSGDKLKFVVAADQSRDYLGKNMLSYKICTLDEAVSEADCFIVAAGAHNAALGVKLKQVVKKETLVINPFKKNGYYETDEIVINPYEGLQNDNTEEQWNSIVANNSIIEAIDSFVRIAKEDVQLFDYIEIETINRCNGTCSFCPVNKIIDPRVEKRMSMELFKSIIGQLEELNYSGELSTFSNNEPLLDERIVELNKYAREHLPNARIHMFTNGTLFTLQKFKDLIPYLDELIIDNYMQDLKLIKPCREIKEYIEEHPELRRKVTIVLRKPQEILTSRGGDAPNRKELVSYGDAKCALPFEQMIVRPDGKVSLCCNDPIGKNTLGDLTKQSILDVWYGKQYQMIRKCISEGRRNWKHCEYCDSFYLY